jgi:hypothetical protein
VLALVPGLRRAAVENRRFLPAPAGMVCGVRKLRNQPCLPETDDKALSGLKFSDALPRPLAVAILITRLADLDHAAVLNEPCRFVRDQLTAAGACYPGTGLVLRYEVKSRPSPA